MQRHNISKYIRSLLAGETLEDNLGVAVDAQVVNGLRVRGGSRTVGAVGDLAKGGRAQRCPGDGLHCGYLKKETIWEREESQRQISRL